MLLKLARRLCWRPSFPISADDDVADEEAEQDEPVGVQQTLVEPKGAHAADHLRKRRGYVIVQRSSSSSSGPNQYCELSKATCGRVDEGFTSPLTVRAWVSRSRCDARKFP